MPTYVFWNDKFSVPIASTVNGDELTTAYTDFDSNDDDNGGWHYDGLKSNNGYLGSKCVSFAWGDKVTRGGIAPGKYVIQYRQRYGNVDVILSGNIVESTSSSSNDHVIQKVTIDVISYSQLLEIDGSGGTIDNLALYPVNSNFTAYEYDYNTMNLASKVSSNEKPIYFDYDSQQRLVAIKDHNNDIVNTHQYNFQPGIGNYYTEENTILKSGVKTLADAQALNNEEKITKRVYTDGLGRPIQITAIESSPNHRDVIEHIEYDQYGIKNKEFLPFTRASNGGQYLTNAPVLQNISYGSFNSFAYSETITENSPIARPTLIAAPGHNWKVGSGNERHNNYRSNLTNEVRLIAPNGSSDSYYPPNTLFVNESYDEDGRITSEYINFIGQKVLINREGAKTYQVYNAHGNITFVVPPRISELIDQSTNPINLNISAYLSGVYQYSYDNRQRLIRKKIPGKNPIHYHYDRLDRVALSVDGNGTKKFNKYDEQGRLIIAGIYNGTALPSSNMALFESRTTSDLGYTTNQSFPTSNYEVHLANYYDSYDLDQNGSMSTSEAYYIYTGNTFSNNVDYDVSGELVAEKKLVLNENMSTTPDYITTRYFYDEYRNVIQEKKINMLNGTDVIFNEYDFNKNLILSQRRNRVVLAGNTISTIILNRYEYDHRSRLIDTYRTINGGDEIHLSKNKYNSRNLLSQKKLGLTNGSNALQSIDYNYNIRNWLTDINNVNSGLIIQHDEFPRDIPGPIEIPD